jgi:hypothetical protein
VQFAQDACPPDSIYGSATAETPLLDQPISGPVYLRSSTHELPDLVLDLRGQIDIEVAATIDTAKSGGLRARFASIPDAPVSKFVLELEGGRKGLLVASEGLCKGLGRAAVRMVGQSGVTTRGRKRLGTSCAGAAKRSKHRRILRARAAG